MNTYTIDGPAIYLLVWRHEVHLVSDLQTHRRCNRLSLRLIKSLTMIQHMQGTPTATSHPNERSKVIIRHLIWIWHMTRSYRWKVRKSSTICTCQCDSSSCKCLWLHIVETSQNSTWKICRLHRPKPRANKNKSRIRGSWNSQVTYHTTLEKAESPHINHWIVVIADVPTQNNRIIHSQTSIQLRLISQLLWITVSLSCLKALFPEIKRLSL